MVVPPNPRTRVSIYPLFLAWIVLVCSSLAQTSATPEQSRMQRPAVTEVPSAQLPEKFRNAPKPLPPDPPSMRYASLREHAPPRIVLPALDVIAYIEEDKQAQKNPMHKVRGGVMRPVNITPDKDGEWSEPEPGVRVWRVEVQSPGAKAIRLRLENVVLTAHAQLFMYVDKPELQDVNSSGQLRPGQDVYSSPMASDRARIELIEDTRDPGQSTFSVSGVGHVYRGSTELQGTYLNPDSCNLDAVCYPDWAHSGETTGLLSYSDTQFIYFCSGAMINNNSGDFSPLFLTAAHCGVNSSNQASVNIGWHFKSASCNAGAAGSSAGSNGVKVLATSAATDTMLLQVIGAEPQDVTWAGWSTDVFSGAVTGIHHPEASYRRISFGQLIADDPSMPDYHRVVWSTGTVEPGSSGSPLFNANQQIVGELWGGNAACGGVGSSYYGKLVEAFPFFTDAQGNNYLIKGLPDDDQAPNQDRAHAKLFGGTVELENLVLKINADDWFKWTIPSHYQLTQLPPTTFPSVMWTASEFYLDDSTQSFGLVGQAYVNDTDSSHDIYLHEFLQPFGTGTRGTYGINYRVGPVQAPVLSPPGLPDRGYHWLTLRIDTIAPSAMTIWAEYGTDPQLNSYAETSHTSVPIINGINSYFFTADGLLPLTTYYVRAAGQTIGGIGKSAIVPMTTSNILPPIGMSPQNGVVGVSPLMQLNWMGGSPISHVYFGTSPNALYLADAIAQLNPYQVSGKLPIFGGKYYWRVESFDGNILASSPLQSYTLTASNLQPSVSAVNFALVLPNLSSTRSFMLTNASGQSITLGSPQLTGPFGYQSDCGTSLAPHASCHVTLSIKTATLGAVSGAVNFLHDGGIDSIAVTANVSDISLGLPRASRTARSATQGAIQAGQSETFRMSVAPSAPVNASAVMSCSGLPIGVTCQMQPAVVDLSAGAKDVDVVVSVASRAQHVASLTTGAARASRLRASPTADARQQTRTVYANVTATVSGAVRTVVLPATIVQ